MANELPFINIGLVPQDVQRNKFYAREKTGLRPHPNLAQAGESSAGYWVQFRPSKPQRAWQVSPRRSQHRELDLGTYSTIRETGKITADSVKRLHAALPDFRILSDHGTFEPEQPAST